MRGDAVTITPANTVLGDDDEYIEAPKDVIVNILKWVLYPLNSNLDTKLDETETNSPYFTHYAKEGTVKQTVPVKTALKDYLTMQLVCKNWKDIVRGEKVLNLGFGRHYPLRRSVHYNYMESIPLILNRPDVDFSTLEVTECCVYGDKQYLLNLLLDKPEFGVSLKDNQIVYYAKPPLPSTLLRKIVNHPKFDPSKSKKDLISKISLSGDISVMHEYFSLPCLLDSSQRYYLDWALRDVIDAGDRAMFDYFLTIPGFQPENCAAHALKTGKYDMLNVLLNYKETTQAIFDTVLGEALKKGELQRIQDLILEFKERYPVISSDLISNALEKELFPLATWLVDKGGIPCGHSLRTAISQQNLDWVKRILSYDMVQPDIKHLIGAAIGGNLEIFKLLINERRMDPSDGEENRVFVQAATYGNSEIVEFLLRDERSDPNLPYNLSVRASAQNGHKRVLELLMADPRVDPSGYNNDALTLAKKNGHEDLAKMLMSDPRVKKLYIQNGGKEEKDCIVM
eukprot:TRINITY_DN6297_c0_g1_i1.p1 TRINITY_DN6297_c0_g1~~TRINITY_DN6297_c0_g1_i1.p1  ORF type:complete len:512 (-),score=102.17 TRINITY_DN6297_c0_g1_i1:17-1552(-)